MSGWHPSSRPQAARRRAAMLDRARQYFLTEDVMPVDTPSLSPFAASDPHIDSLRVYASSGGRFFLRTSPEFHMKRLLAAGYPNIYSICRVFRDGEIGKRHLPEFTMIEWYRLGFKLPAIVADAAMLIAHCLDDASLIDSAFVIDYRDAFARFAGIDVLTASHDELASSAKADKSLRKTLGKNRDMWLDLVLAAVVAPKFAADRLTVLQHFPASKAALARLCPDDRQLADRFEIFMGSMELANGYVELTDAAEQRRRVDGELQQRRNMLRTVAPRDERLLEALDAGLPRCAGVAVGVERLQMLLDGTDDIGDVVTFSFEAGDS